MRLDRLFSLRFSVIGLLVGTVFFAFSLTPSLVPRPPVTQGIISGLSLIAGYAIGVFGRWLWGYLELPIPGTRVEWLAKRIAAATYALLGMTFLWWQSVWQDSVRTLMEMEKTAGVQFFGLALIAVLLFGALLLVGRLFGETIRFVSRKLQRFIPRRVANVAGVLVSLALFWSLIDGVLFTLVLRMADNSYQQVDALIDADIKPPGDPLQTGSPASLIAWADLGRHGRKFVSSRPRASELSAFLGEPAPAPIRVYVGLNSAETAKGRARLALQELKRVGGFERSVLMLVTPTGSGWIDPAAQRTVEYLHRGDIATVAAQYSYLPSSLSLMVEGEYGEKMARALFEQVYGYWTTLPPDHRPALYLHGLSLGALNSERSFDFFDIVEDPFEGALWSGPPFRSEIRSRATNRRRPDSPAWLPRFQDSSVVRFMNQETGLNDHDGQWGGFRIAFLQYASDPVSFFEPRSFYTKPAWMAEPRGPDVSPELRWFPIVTMLQLMADMWAGTAPPGFGHNYAAEHYIDAWLALTEPQGWNDGDIRRLKALYEREE